MNVMTRIGASSALCFAVLGAEVLIADVVQIPASADNTIFEESEGFSNGGGSYFFAGSTAQARTRRGLIKFDIAAAVPAGSTINSVELTLFMSKTIVGPTDISLHRATADWGEGNADAVDEEGAGIEAVGGDATWVNTFFPSAFWANPGGDFDATISDTQSVGDIDFYTWGSTATMVSDVQGWLDNPSGNYGWVLVGSENAFTAKRFDSRENSVSTNRPVLEIDFDPPSACPGDLAEPTGVVDVQDLLALFAEWGGCPAPCDADLAAPFGVVDVQDLLALFSFWGPC